MRCASLLLSLTLTTASAAAFQDITLLKTHTLNAYDTLWSAAVSPDGHTLALGSSDLLQTRDLITGNLKWKSTVIHDHADWAGSLKYSRDGSTLFALASTVTIDGTNTSVHVFLADTGRLISMSGDFPDLTAYAPNKNGQNALFGDPQGHVALIDTVSWKGVSLMPSMTRARIREIRYRPNTYQAGFTDDAEQLTLWTVDEESRRVNLPYKLGDLQFHPSRPWLAVGTAAGTVELVDVDTTQVVRQFKTGTSLVNTVAFNKNGTLLAAGDARGQVNVFASATGRKVWSLSVPNVSIEGVWFGGDNKTLVVRTQGRGMSLAQAVRVYGSKRGAAVFTGP
ncbi:WD40 repeat domain-containing protein [Deinococcus pimensis]|uniref:WD40 repeat domain-containing protein n=1 Tax=Deinococcus pimensis TaxID=309888 RepID=UPI00048A1DA7|nr:hypothetical protein [Deinococcus pimensis]